MGLRISSVLDECLFKKSSLSTYSVPGTLLKNEDTVRKQALLLLSQSFEFSKT